ncbi:MAG: FAD-binding domain-containing protein [Pseudomonadota bacterium]
MTQTSFLTPEAYARVTWEASRQSAEARLHEFLPFTGKAYARRRNFDLGPDDRSNVSALSPWVRHRLLLEEEVLQATLEQHDINAAEKFIQEVLWRGYFKGWLEHRPEVWSRYKRNLTVLIDKMETDAGLAQRYADATSGKTGIACFDAWANELVDTGYLHNHARMWFASIWIFTLQLPWELGADFFFRHLLDGDPASNTCSWRWVGGLHTQGKTYLARADNIEQFTEGRFNPAGQLANDARSLQEPGLPGPQPPDTQTPEFDGQRVGLLITEEDTSPESLSSSLQPTSILAITEPAARSVLPTGPFAQAFTKGSVEDAVIRAEQRYGMKAKMSGTVDLAETLRDWVQSDDLDGVVTARLPIGPARKLVTTASADLPVPLVEITRTYDHLVWPHAAKGFFGLKKRIPMILGSLDGVRL